MHVLKSKVVHPELNCVWKQAKRLRYEGPWFSVVAMPPSSTMCVRSHAWQPASSS